MDQHVHITEEHSSPIHGVAERDTIVEQSGLDRRSGRRRWNGLVLSGFARVVTHPRIFDLPSTPEEALAFIRVHPRRTGGGQRRCGRTGA
jgi:hypothetical protein